MQHLLLGEGDIVKVANTSLPKGTFVKLQPISKEFLEVHNPRAVLENSLRHFATLTKGDNIVIGYNKKKFEIEIVETKPADAISIIEADIEVDFAPPKDYVEPVREVPPATSSEAATNSTPPTQAVVFSGSGYRLDGKPIKQTSTAPVRGEHPLLQKMNKVVVSADGSISKAEEILPGSQNVNEPWKNKIPGGVRREPPYGYLHLLEERKRRI